MCWRTGIAGRRLVLDDFGTGYSMLGYLKPCDQCAEDRPLVIEASGDADSRAIVHAMPGRWRGNSDLKSVAEVWNRKTRSITCARSAASSRRDSSTPRGDPATRILDYLARERPVSDRAACPR